MNAELQFVLEHTREQMEKSILHLEAELTKIRAGKANPAILHSVQVDYYGVKTPLNQVSSITTPDGRTLMVQPWEKSMLEQIQKAILAANLGFNPGNNGTAVIISVPALTEERRKELVKKAKHEGELAKVGLRNARKIANEEIKKLQKSGVAEDEAKEAELKIQKLTDDYAIKVDRHIEVKEKEIMTV
jgi:ribosome recycling factor